ncbi:MAG TPA: cysteine desulfurase family protein [Armatimonadota bacterium]|nr:cysteine desulfurase family protein [Armatimonadota bacterium]
MPDRPIYLDHNATTPVDPRVLKVMLPYFTEIFGNAASVDHEYGYEAKQAVDRAREQIATVINARPDEIIFTSGATESNNIALFGVAEKYASRGDHIITCVTEHRAVLDPCRRLEQMGKRVTYLSVDQYGLVDPDDVRRAITAQTVLISIMTANNEIGTIAPVAEIGKIAKEHDVLFHTDAAQAVGHIPMDVQAMNIDIMSMSAHKMYGPKGVGALYRRRSNPHVLLAPVIYGGGHEKGLRSGTLNVPGVVGMGEAVELCAGQLECEAARLRKLRTQMFLLLKERAGDLEINGHPTRRLPHNLNLYIPDIEGRSLMVGLKGIAMSTGSACTSQTVEASHVIESLGFGTQRAHSSVRFGLGRSTDFDNVLSSAECISAAVWRLRTLAKTV